MRELTCSGGGLRRALRGERDVDPALPTALDVPFRLAVPDDQHLLHRPAHRNDSEAGGV